MPEIKETNYWINNKVRKIIGEYSNYFNKKNGIWMEVDPKYIYYPEKIKQLKTSFKTVKIIILVRDPFERYKSLLAFREMIGGKSDPDIETAIFIYKNIIDLQTQLPVMCISFRDFINNTDSVIKSVCDFIKIQYEPCDYSSLRKNSSREPKFKLLNKYVFKMVHHLKKKQMDKPIVFLKNFKFLQKTLYKSKTTQKYFHIDIEMEKRLLDEQNNLKTLIN